MGARRGLQETGLVLAAVAAYELARPLIHPDAASAVRHAHGIVSLERSLGLAREASLQHALLPAASALGVVYLLAQFGVTGLFFLWLYRRAPGAYARWRNAFLVATALALLVQWRYPVAPPRLAGVGIDGTIPLRGVGSVTDPFAAVPSLHAGWALGVGLGLARHARSRAARVAGWLYPPLVVLATIVTGNHFLLDAAAGAAVMGAGLWASGLVLGRHGRVPRAHQPLEQGAGRRVAA